MEFIVFVLVIVVAIVAAALYNNVRRTTDLEQRLQILSRTLGKLLRDRTESAPAPAPATAPARAAIPPAAAPAQPAPAAPLQAPIIPTPPPRVASRTQQEWETLIGEKLLNRIGAVALVIGVGFFLKYAFERDLIPPIVRVLIGVIAGVGLVIAASQKRATLPVFAQGLLGAGISILYLSAYASFNFYQLIPQVMALMLMGAITALALERALKFDSLAVAVLGLIGGFITPPLLSNGQSTGAGLFIYLAALNVGLLMMARKKDEWWVLEPLSLAFTYIIFFGSQASNFERETFTQVALFVTVIWMMFYANDLDRTLRKVATLERPRQVIAMANGALYYAAIGFAVNAAYPRFLSLVTFMIGLAYLLPILLLKRSLARYTIKAIILIVTATGLELSGLLLIVAWAVEALVALAAGMNFRLHHSRLAGLAIFALGTVSLLGTDGALAFNALSPDRFTPLLNVRALTFISVALCAAAAGFAYRQFEADEKPWASPSLHYLWTALIFILIAVETQDWFRRIAGGEFSQIMLMVLVWAIYSVVLSQLGTSERVPAILHSSIAAFTIAVLVGVTRGAEFEPVSDFLLLFNARAGVLLILVAAAAAHFFISRRNPDKAWTSGTAFVMQGASGLILFVLATAEARDYFQNRILTTQDAAVIDRLKNLKQLSISAVWMIYSAIAMGIGIYRRSRTLRLSAIAIFGLAILKVFLYDLSFLDQLYRIFSFIGLGLILLGASYAYTRYRDIILGTTETDAVT
ncbi:MAG: DUF2339 domain-containing protein [Actinomycetota bacterium]